jgi:prevent-host-death family protein
MEALMTRLAASKARDDFADTLNRVAYGRERIVLRRRGKDLAALVPMEDLALIEKLEAAIDVRGAKKALAEMKRKGEKPVPYEKARRELGLK